MRLHKTSRPLTPEEIRERNIQRNREQIFNPPKPSLWDRFRNQLFEVGKWWCRHVTQRELYRLLDGARLVKRQDRPDPAVMLQRLRDAWNSHPEHRQNLPDPDVVLEKLQEDGMSYPEYYPWGDDDERP